MRKLYKFLPAHWASVAIKDQKLKISLLGTLNDPWELMAVKSSDVTAKSGWKKVVNMISQSRGVICFSKGWENPVHWSHYADLHRGIALGFEVIEKDAVGTDITVDVEYRDELVPLPEDLFPFLEPTPHKTAFIQSAIATKYTGWSYEDEVRYFARLDEPDESNGHFFADFGNELVLKEVIFGLRYDRHEEMTAILARLRSVPGIDCWKAALGIDSFHMIKDPNWTYFQGSNP